MKRFWSKTKRNPETGCIEWTAMVHRDFPYGLFYWKGRNRVAHRVAWRLAYGSFPDGQVVRHKCDNPRCVNVDHLELGSQADNVADMVERGRQYDRTGENNPKVRLNEVAVRVIRYMAAKGVPHRKLARVHGVHKSTVTAIVRGLSWTHVGGPTTDGDIRGEKSPNAKVTELDVRAIRWLVAGGLPQVRLTWLYGVDKGTVSSIVRRTSWAHIT